MTLRKVFCLAVVLLCGALLTSGCAVRPACTNQSPRNLNRDSQPPPVYRPTDRSIVGTVTPGPIGVGTIEYIPRGSNTPRILRKCSQHYHYPIETPQGCPEEPSRQGTSGSPAGEWIEIHTAYSAIFEEPCRDPQSTDCCKGDVAVVRGFAAKVTQEGPGGPIVEPSGRPLFEWSGSTTGPDKVPNECKPPAQWSFRLGCDFTVSAAQLREAGFTAQRPRGLQTGSRISDDLVLVNP